MEGRIYIAGAFNAVGKVKCVVSNKWLDNDPHLSTSPPTWGICRYDFRNNLSCGDHVFFVLPKKSPLPQMIFAHLRIKEVISHIDAFKRPGLRSKRMKKGKNPQGNILVDNNGNYNYLDGGIHKENFLKIKERYAIGEMPYEVLSKEKIIRLSNSFLEVLGQVLEKTGKQPIDIIGRRGRILNEKQIQQLLSWLNS